MRKQTKIAAVVSAAALLALGASMTSFAASKGTWMMVDGEWYCYDKNGWILGYRLNPGNQHDSRTFKSLYDKINRMFMKGYMLTK